MSFTPIKDVNLEIMSKMDDKTLLNTCLSSKYGRELCKNESFWYKRLLEKYGDRAVKYKPEDRTWKNHYMRVVKDTNSISPRPHILSRVIWDPRGAEYSKYVDPVGNSFPFLHAPEKILNAFYFMDLGPEFQNKTAFQFLQERAKGLKSPIIGQNIFLQYRIDQLAQGNLHL